MVTKLQQQKYVYELSLVGVIESSKEWSHIKLYFSWRDCINIL